MQFLLSFVQWKLGGWKVFNDFEAARVAEKRL
jgi:hypothetical protein